MDHGRVVRQGDRGRGVRFRRIVLSSLAAYTLARWLTDWVPLPAGAASAVRLALFIGIGLVIALIVWPEESEPTTGTQWASFKVLDNGAPSFMEHEASRDDAHDTARAMNLAAGRLHLVGWRRVGPWHYEGAEGS